MQEFSCAGNSCVLFERFFERWEDTYGQIKSTVYGTVCMI